MSSRPWPDPYRNRSREHQEEFPPLPVPRIPRIPSLRSLASSRELPRVRERHDGSSFTAPSSLSNSRPQSRPFSTVSRRAERIHNLDDLDRSMDHAWSSSQHPARARNMLQPRTQFDFDFDDLGSDHDERNSNLQSLLDRTITPMPPPYSPPPRHHDFPDDNRRSKRRKLDADRGTAKFKNFRYGKYGQVEPGRLRMEIVSCDGGTYEDGDSYVAENIFKDDDSVYCTKGNRCNLVLQHQGAALFTLEELVIKTPAESNFDNPVREGIVFVAMDHDDILRRTAHYQIQYASKREEEPWLEPEADPHVYMPDSRHILSINYDDSAGSTRLRPSFARGEDRSYRIPQMPKEFTANVPDFKITTECTDEEDFRGSDLRPSSGPARNLIGSLPFESNESDSDDYNPFGTEDFTDDLQRYNDRDRDRDHHRNRSSLALADAWEAHNHATQEAARAEGGELLVPHARFFIEKEKSKCTIRFDPPVSGRFILLKMWSTKQTFDSMDIKSIMAHGFSGPRYFPSVELR